MPPFPRKAIKHGGSKYQTKVVPCHVGEECYCHFADEDINRVIVHEVKDLQQLCYEVTNETQGDEHSFQLLHHEIFEPSRKLVSL